MYLYPGLTMTLNGADAAHQTFGTPQEEVQEWDVKMYLGRSLSDMVRERYANAIFERLDIWNARKQYLETHSIIRTNRNGGVVVTERPIIITPAPPVLTQPPVTRAPVTRAPVTRAPVTRAPVAPPIIVDGRDRVIIYVNGTLGTLPARPTSRPTPRKFL